MVRQNNTKLPILYSFRRCPYAIRARIGILYSEVQVELREVVLKQKPQQMLEISQKGTVPVLLLPNGDVIDESIDILHWCLQHSDRQQWKIGDVDLQAEAIQLVAENDGEFKQYLDQYKYADRFPAHPQAYYREQGETFLIKLNRRLERQQFLLGAHITYADVCIFPFIRQFAHVDKRWFYSTNYCSLQRWLNYWLDSELFDNVMAKYPPWHAGAEPLVFPH